MVISNQNAQMTHNYRRPLRSGTTFTICMPGANEPAEAPKTLSSPSPASNQAADETVTVLLVEDEPGIRLIIRRFLQKQNYLILEASHPREALEICRRREGPIDLLITDLMMPYMNGRDLAKRLVAFYPDLKILYISGYAGAILKKQAGLEPDIVFLEKPFSSEALAGKVREALAS